MTSTSCLHENQPHEHDRIPKNIFIISGKRKSGKDFISDLLLKRLGTDLCSVLRLSGPLKRQYAQENGLDYQRLLDASDYKEKYREDMIRWGEEKRNKDTGFFCNLITKEEGSDKKVWIISDARRHSDIDFFKKKYEKETITIRIHSDLNVRVDRGFIFKKGIDDAESECGLDQGVEWDFYIKNNGDDQLLQDDISKIINAINLS